MILYLDLWLHWQNKLKGPKYWIVGHMMFWSVTVDDDFIGCIFLIFLGALSYAELGTMITKSGAEYAYLQEAFSPLHRTLGPLPSFLFAWTSVLILKPALFGVTSMSFAVYAVEPFYGKCGPDNTMVKVVAVICLCMYAMKVHWGLDNAYYFVLSSRHGNLSKSVLVLLNMGTV